MGAKTLRLMTLEKESAESWVREAGRGLEQAKRVRVLCRVMASAGEALDEDDREIFLDLIDELGQDTEGQFVQLIRFLGAMERVGLSKITMKKQEAA